MNKMTGNWFFIYPIARKRPVSQGQGGRTKIGRLGTAPRAAVWARAAITAALLLGASLSAFAQPRTPFTAPRPTPPACLSSTISKCCTVTISGSYSLNTNVSYPPVLPTWTDCIDVTASDVSIDLKGFTILGHIPFALATGAYGINAIGQSVVSVRNGIVGAFGTANVALGDGGIVENVQSYGPGNGTGGDGIRCGKGCLLRDNVVIGNGGFGLVFSPGDTSSGYTENVLSNNTTDVSGGTSMINKNTNLCDGSPC